MIRDATTSPRDGAPATLPDLLAPGLRLLFVGFNPSIRAARLGHYYAGRNNRFWHLLAQAGIVPAGTAPAADRGVLARGIGFTDLVKRPTRSAAELAPHELSLGAARIRALVAELRPRVVCYTGKGVYLRAAGRAAAPWGRQPRPLEPPSVDFVAPSPSGLARIPLAEKARWYAGLAELMEEVCR